MQKSNLKIIISIIVCFILSASFSINLNAQPTMKAKERLDMIKKIKLMEHLNLSDDAAEKFLVKYSSYENKIQERFKAMDDLEDEIRSALKKNDSKDLKAKADKMLQLQDEFSSLVNEKNKSLRGMLSDEQFAKYLIFERTFQKEVRRMLFERKDEMRNKPRNKRDRRDQGSLMPPPPEDAE